MRKYGAFSGADAALKKRVVPERGEGTQGGQMRKCGAFLRSVKSELCPY
jgi:hypothetical protein